MKKKIVIIGGLGYIGTELCKIYSGESWSNSIIVIDSRFVSERVAQLRDWKIDFKQGGLLDKDFLKRNLFDADIVFHLAGIKGSPQRCMESPASFSVPMVQFNANMIEAAYNADVEWFLYTS